MTEERADSVINGGPPALSLPRRGSAALDRPGGRGTAAASAPPATEGPRTCLARVRGRGPREWRDCDRGARGGRDSGAPRPSPPPGGHRPPGGGRVLATAHGRYLGRRGARRPRRRAHTAARLDRRALPPPVEVRAKARRAAPQTARSGQHRGAPDSGSRGRPALATDGVGHLGWLGVGGMATMAAVATSELGASAVSGIYAGGGSADGGADGGGDSAGGGGDGGGGGG